MPINLPRAPRALVPRLFLLSPISAKQLGLLKNGLRCLLLFVRGITVLTQDTFYSDADFGAHGFALGPVNRDAVADGLDEFVSDLREGGFAKNLYGAVVDFERVVKGKLVFCQLK